MQPATLDVTLVIPMRNEASRIGCCLDSILTNPIPKGGLEILVADGSSTDASRTIVEERAARFPSIRLLDNPSRIVPAGLNIAIRQARGRVIIIVGAHSEYPRDFVNTCLRELERTNADAVGGTLLTRPGSDRLVAKAVALMTCHPFGVGGSHFRTRRTAGFVDTVPYGAYRREVFERVGLFSERLPRNQDFEFNARVRSAGGRLFLSPDIEITYYNVPTFKKMVLQAFTTGVWLSRMWLASPSSFRLRHAIPMVFVSALLACALLAPVTHIALQLGLMVLLSYAIAAIIAAVQISWRNGAKFFFPLLALFFVYHCLYGMGTIGGLFPSPKIAAPARS